MIFHAGADSERRGMLYIKHSVWLKWVGVAQILEDLECQSLNLILLVIG